MAHVDCRNASAEPAADSALGECAIGSARRAVHALDDRSRVLRVRRVLRELGLGPGGLVLLRRRHGRTGY